MERTRAKARYFISDLPENVIESILELLPIEDAVKTSALARNWRYNWTTISELKFGEDFYLYLSEKSLVESGFVNIITNILLVHRGTTIRKITLIIPSSSGLRNIQNWMIYLSRKGVKEFALDYRSSEYEFFKLPSHMFAFLDLTDLEINNCAFKPPPGFRGFPKLVSLKLSSVTLDEDSFKRLISSSLLLETLRLCNCYHPYHLTIHSRSLSYLFLGGQSKDELVSVHVVAENITTLWLTGCFRMQLEDMSFSNMIEELGRLPKLEELFIGYGIFKTIIAGCAPRRLPVPLFHLKRIVIDKLDFTDPAQEVSFLCLIRSAPNLQEMHIVGARIPSNDEEQASTFRREDFALNCLQTVIISRVRGSRNEMEFIKFVLASSPSLELLVVFVETALDDEVGLPISEELFKLHKASPKAKVLFKHHCSSCDEDDGCDSEGSSSC